MPRFRYAKLVRDNIVDKQIASGAKLHYRTLTPKEHKQALIQKLTEEAAEISQASSGELTSEIADVLQVIDDLIEIYGLSKDDVLKAQATKKQKNGAFKKGHYIDYIDVTEDNAWVAYHRKDPTRFPELKDQS